MNFKEAINYTVDNHEKIDDDQICVVGVSYQPNDSNGEFKIISLSYEDKGFNDNAFNGLSDLDSEVWLEEATEDDYDLTNKDSETFGVDHDEESRWYKANIYSGNLLSSESIEDSHKTSTIDDLVAELPAYAMELNYQVYEVSASKMYMKTEDMLKLLFPELPNIDEQNKAVSITAFKQAAINKLTTLNNSN